MLRSRLASVAKHALAQLTALIKTRLEWVQYPPDFLGGLVAKTGSDRLQV
ncbi:hypothetical protein [Streptomyces sp. NPDC020951]